MSKYEMIEIRVLMLKELKEKHRKREREREKDIKLYDAFSCLEKLNRS